jgi:hypothetical protein
MLRQRKKQVSRWIKKRVSLEADEVDSYLNDGSTKLSSLQGSLQQRKSSSDINTKVNRKFLNVVIEK